MYDEHGNLVTSTMTQYLVPSAAEMPSFELDRTETPVDHEPARRQGHRRGGDDRRAARRDQRGDRRGRAPRRHRRRQAGHARTRLASHPGGEGRCSMIPAPFEYQRVEFVDHAIQVLSDHPDAKLLAGGHSLLPLMRLRLARPSLLVDISRIQDLKYIKEDGDHVAIGALTRHHDVANSDGPTRAVSDRVLCGRRDRRPAGPPRRDDRRLGGARRPGLGHADRAARPRRRDGRAQGPRATFGTCRRRTSSRASSSPTWRPNEVLTEIRVPESAGRGWSYIKFHRRAQDWALVGVAALAQNGAGPAVALTNMG